ncbi:hypothetical protein GCM10023143_30530 [Compostibacter hankyongensis]|uniref:DUF5615 domain-containing protein n=2 Tax=Compostibacter hankyongensis TaxID=1007089 RepID=A0ABP8G605_9BACT
MNKDDDFIRLLELQGRPPQIIWITCGNSSNNRMREILSRHLEVVVELLRKGEPYVEITGE